MSDLVVIVVLAALLLFALASTLLAETLAGTAVIEDGDTLEFVAAGERVRLEGIDAPESGQHCLDAVGKRYRCGQSATEALKRIIASRPVRCEGSQRGRWGRLIAVCFNADGMDLNGWLVSEGWALAYRRYSRRYVREEAAARQAKRGIWSGRFVKPWDWRRGKRLD